MLILHRLSRIQNTANRMRLALLWSLLWCGLGGATGWAELALQPGLLVAGPGQYRDQLTLHTARLAALLALRYRARQPGRAHYPSTGQHQPDLNNQTRRGIPSH